MKLSLLLIFLALFSVVLADEPPPDEKKEGEYSAPKALEDDAVKDTDTLMKLLRDGDKKVMDIIYIIGIKDSNQKDSKRVKETEEMEYDMATLKFEDV